MGTDDPGNAGYKLILKNDLLIRLRHKPQLAWLSATMFKPQKNYESNALASRVAQPLNALPPRARTGLRWEP